jgi:hypothetical protein
MSAPSSDIRVHVNASGRLACAAALLGMLLASAGCTFPGPVAPSTLPLSAGKYVELSAPETASSCGVTVMGIRFKNPQSLSGLIDEMVKARAGDALVNVDSSSYYFWFFFGATDCIDIRGTVVKISR